MPHGELPGRLECLGPLGVWLKPGRADCLPAATCAQNRNCGQAIGAEEGVAGSKPGAAVTLKSAMVMPLEHFSLSGFGKATDSWLEVQQQAGRDATWGHPPCAT